MSEAVDYVALLTAVPSVLVVGDESFEFSLGLAEAAAARGKSAGRWLCATAYEAAPVDAAAATGNQKPAWSMSRALCEKV